MHRFWEIDEMVRLVATALEKHYTASASAVALARCSKRLGDIVLDSLWEQLTGLGLLLKCLPSDTWEVRDDEFIFRRCPSTKEWTQFASYACRIRTLRVWDGSPGPKVPLQAFHLLSMQAPTLGHYPLPNLRSINWGICSWDLIPFLRLFLNPGLVNVQINFPDGNPHLYRPVTVSLIPTGDLTHLRLESMEEDSSSLDALHNLLDEASETLRAVSLDGKLSMSVLEKLLQLPNLSSLDVRLPETRISPPEVVFPSLKNLVVGYREAGSWLHILGNIPTPTLQELDVTFSGSSPGYLQTLVSSLLDANIERTLISLRVKCSSENRAPLTEAGVGPLLSFEGLTTLELITSCTDNQCGFQLDDSIVSELAMALPQLTSLVLGDTPCKASTLGVTVASLVALSTNCADLDLLRLHFNTNDITSRNTHANPQTHKFACKLRTLEVGSQPLPSNPNDILLVTFTILHIFPHVETILSVGENWKEVRQAVQLFREVPKIISLPTGN